MLEVARESESGAQPGRPHEAWESLSVIAQAGLEFRTRGKGGSSATRYVLVGLEKVFWADVVVFD